MSDGPDANVNPMQRAAAFGLLMEAKAKEKEFIAAIVFRNADRQAVLRDEMHALLDGKLDAQKIYMESIK